MWQEGMLSKINNAMRDMGRSFSSMSTGFTLDNINSKEDPQYLRVVAWVDETTELTVQLQKDLEVLIERFNSGANNSVLMQMGFTARQLQSCDAYGTAALILYSGKSQNGTWNYCMEKFAEAMNLLSGEVSRSLYGCRKSFCLRFTANDPL